MATNILVFDYTDPIVRTIEMADLNNDGAQDLAVGFEDENRLVIILQNEGKFTVFTNYTIGSEAYYCVYDDFNGDGFIDIITESDILLGKGNGEFVVLSNILSDLVNADDDEFPFSIAATDINLDNKPDILLAYDHIFACTNYTSPSLQIQVSDNKASISWTLWSGYSLESTTNLESIVSWRLITNGIIQTNGRNLFRLNSEIPTMYFRLKSE